VTRTLPLRADQLRGGGSTRRRSGLSLHRLPEADRHGVSRRHREPAGDVRAEERDSEESTSRPRRAGASAPHAFCPESARRSMPPRPSRTRQLVDCGFGGIDQRAQLAPPARQIWCPLGSALVDGSDRHRAHRNGNNPAPTLRHRRPSCGRIARRSRRQLRPTGQKARQSQLLLLLPSIVDRRCLPKHC